MNTLIILLDLFGTFVFGFTGGLKAVRHGLDLFGLAVLAVFTGLGGGIIRDLVIGATPPAAFHNEWYFIAALGGGLGAYLWRLIRNDGRGKAGRNPLLNCSDAVGLAIFAGIGASAGCAAQLGPIGTVITGILTATGGGIIRDLLVGEIPLVLRTDIYATAALAGSLACYYLQPPTMPTSSAILAAALLTFLLRITAFIFHLQLPAAGRRPVND